MPETKLKEEEAVKGVKMTRDEAAAAIAAMVDEKLGSAVDKIADEMKTQIAALTAPKDARVLTGNVDGAMRGLHDSHQRGDHVYETMSGSLMNLKSPRSPWLKLSPEVEEWAAGIATFVKSRGNTVEKVLVEGTGASGGFTVPDEFVATIVMYDAPEVAMWSRATIWPMGTDKLGMPRLAQDAYDATEANIDHFAGVSFTWVEETDEKPEVEPTFEFLELIAHELVGYTELTNALLEDSPINLMNFLTSLYGKAWMFGTDQSFFRGNGVGQPLGIINDPRILTVNRTTAGTVVFADLLNMDNMLHSVFDSGAVWFGTKAVLNSLRGQVDTNGQLVLREYWSDAAGGLMANLLGYPFIKADQRTMGLGTKGDLILCNPIHYYIGDRRRYSIDLSPHFRFRHNRMAVRLQGRLDGQPAQSEAFVVLDDVSNAS